MKKEDVFEVFQFLFAVIIFVVLVLVVTLGAKSCVSNYEKAQQTKSKYIATYGNFVRTTTYKFNYYEFVDSRYVLYDESGNVVGDILVTGNNRLDIKLLTFR